MSDTPPANNGIWRDFHPTTDTLLSVMVIGVLALLSGALLLTHPHPVSKDLLLIIIGALAGALSVGGKKADKITNSSGPDATIQPDAELKP